MIWSILVAILIIWWLGYNLDVYPKRGRDKSLHYNNFYGDYRVRYPDGTHSQRFCWDVANDYARIFGGQVYNIKQPGFLANCACKSCVDNGARC